MVSEKRGAKKIAFSESTRALETMGSLLGESMLVSTYDIHHRLMLKPQSFFKGRKAVFLDSGGYELAPDFDSTEPSQGVNHALPFTESNYIAVLKKLPRDVPLVIANFDWGVRGRSVKEQMQNARELFEQFPGTVKNFILKPTGRRRYLDVDEVRQHVEDYRSFDILGLTEKELGRDFLERLDVLARIKAEMDRRDVKIPIHIWGGLDPVMTPLYFFAGAEIFDGVSWLRYVYHKGSAVYRDCYGPLELGLETSLDRTRAHAMNDNLIFLRRLTTTLRRFVDGAAKDFGVFEWHGDRFKAAYAVMESSIKDMRGGT